MECSQTRTLADPTVRPTSPRPIVNCPFTLDLAKALSVKRHVLWSLPFLLLGSPAMAQQSQADLVRPTEAADLNAHLARLASNPRDVAALIGAGEAALALDDPRAAAGFFARADAIQSGNGRIKAGLGRMMLSMQNPVEALRLFDQAGRLGYPDATILSDRGLAKDMTGDQAGAQKDYQAALKRTPDDAELIRRYAASLGISGQVDAAEKVLQPLLYKSDRAAWRYRAFILAMNNRQADAKKIAEQTMPMPLAAGLMPYMQRMPFLNGAQKAAAVHFGHFPTSTGTQIAAITPTAPAFAAASSAAATPAPPPQTSGRAARRAGDRAGIERTPRAGDRRASGAGVQVAQATPTPAPAPVPSSLAPAVRSAAVPAAPIIETPPAAAPIPAPSRATEVVQPLPSAPAPTPVATPAPVRSAAAEQPLPAPPPAQASASPPPSVQVQGPPAPGFQSVAPVTPAPDQPVALASADPVPAAPAPATPAPDPAATRSLADIIRAIDVPDAERQSAVAAVDLAEIEAIQAARRAEKLAVIDKAKKVAAAKAKAEADAKAKVEAAEKKKLADNPARAWVQIATGANRGALAFTLKAMRGKYKAIAPQDAWVAPWGRTNRLVIGPFASFTRAKAVEVDLKAKGADVFAWNSDAGEEVERMSGK